MAVDQKKAERSNAQEPSRRDIPLDSSGRAERESLGDLEGRRQHLSTEEEMARRNQRSHLMRQKNRLRARR
jgi:hypothetical protein